MKYHGGVIIKYVENQKEFSDRTSITYYTLRVKTLET